jgi:hypothetical protein
VNAKGIRTTADVAEALAVSEREAGRQLREAKREGLVDQQMDESRNVPADFERWFWHLTQEGWNEWDRLDAERE